MLSQMDKPNHFDLHGICYRDTDIQIVYSTTSITGKPIFNYTDSKGTKNFTGDQIRTQETNIGTMVTVLLELFVDSGGIDLTLLVPPINLGGSAQEFKTIAILTTTRISIHLPPIKGASKSYEVIDLQGTADSVIS